MADGYDARLPATERRRLGAWYTPDALVQHVVHETIVAVRRGATVTVLDPACGDGRFLHAAAIRVRALGGVPRLTGIDIDGRALHGVEAGGPEPIELIEADALHHDFGARRFDVVVGNPPFLSQMAAATVRDGGSRFGGGPYADAAADFLALAVQLADPAGGRVGLVLPLSLLTARDAGPIRDGVLRSASMQWCWWSQEPLFDAVVRTCAVGLQRGAPLVAVRRHLGIDFAPTSGVMPPGTGVIDDHWGWLIADSHGVPALPPLVSSGTIGDRALVTANFRDQYYGLVGAVSDEGDGPPLITTGLIDPGVCHWATRSARFAKTTYVAPRVSLGALAPFMQRWAQRCLVPKVLVATQSRVIEAVVDEHGRWLPAVPVIRLVPTNPGDLWQIAAVLTSPVASALIAAQSVGSGLSASTVRVSQRTLAALPWPAGDLTDAAQHVRDGDVRACGLAVDLAFGVATDDPSADWWLRGLPA